MSRWQHHERVTDYYYAVFLESQYVVSCASLLLRWRK